MGVDRNLRTKRSQGPLSSEGFVQYRSDLQATVREIIPQIYHLTFNDNDQLAHTLMRFSEYYESPRFKGRVFTRQEFVAWYSKEYGKGTFTYASDYSGFNVPWYILKPFYSGRFDPLSREEKALLSCFNGLPSQFYIIATSLDTGSPRVLEHELAHGLWAMRDEYRRQAQAIVRTIPDTNLRKVTRLLGSRCYHRDTFEDEIHAYLLSDGPCEHLGLQSLNCQHRALQKLFRQFSGNWEYTTRDT